VVWVTGLGHLAETVEDYGLTAAGEPQLREAPRKGVLWREFVSRDGVPFLFSRHPTGARPARGEHDQVFGELARLAEARRRREPQGLKASPSERR
jgi:hypothetical protein